MDKTVKKEPGHLCIGLLAHVDAGKTTLSESLLFASGRIRRRGRVDHGDAFLDTHELEKKRGITIFTKQAELRFEGRQITLLDTPGHADFSPEAERTLQVLDAAVLVISAADGVTGQVRTLWKLLAHYQVPVFLFINKMDQPGSDAGSLLRELRRELGGQCVDFGGTALREERSAVDQISPTEDGTAEADTSRVFLSDEAIEDLVMADEELMERYLQGEAPDEDEIRSLVSARKVFPCFFGSALRQQGIRALLEGLVRFAPDLAWPSDFGARCFKVSADEQGQRLTWLRVTGGVLRVRDAFPTARDGSQEKVTRIRICEGSGGADAQEVPAGAVCAVTGLSGLRPGDGLGSDPGSSAALLQPFSTRSILLEEGADLAEAMQKLRILEEEEPMLHIEADPVSGEISAQIMGQVQTEILREVLRERFGLRVRFGPGSILYKETIAAPVEGVGHYEPLRHYAEVHLLLEPTGPGSGLTFRSSCSTDDLRLHWQRLILSQLQEKRFRGVLTGSDITDMCITVTGGRAHEKHTEGGDFREAAWRAVRQGLMTAQNVLLEPWLSLTAETASEHVGRILTDVRRMGGTASVSEMSGDGRAVIEGSVPAASAASYPEEFTAAVHGEGRLELALREYAPCRDPEAVIAAAGYDPDADTEQPSWSVFCSHGAGTPVPWDQVRDYMHVDTGWRQQENPDAGMGQEELLPSAVSGRAGDPAASWKERERRFGAEEEELRRIFEKTYGGASSWTGRQPRQEPSSWEGSRDFSGPASGRRNGNAGGVYAGARGVEAASEGRARGRKSQKKKTACLLVDGYNVIHASEELGALAKLNLDAAREALLDALSDYHGMRDGEVIAVFDAWRVPGGTERSMKYRNLFVVFTKEAETADAYIERTVHALASSRDVTVATSDGLEQMIILGEGARRMSARELLSDMRAGKEEARSAYPERTQRVKSGVFEGAAQEVSAWLETLPEEPDMNESGD